MKNLLLVLTMIYAHTGYTKQVTELVTVDGKKAAVYSDDVIALSAQLKRSPETFKAEVTPKDGGALALLKNVHVIVDGKNLGVRAGSEDTVCKVSGFKNALKWVGHNQESAKSNNIKSQGYNFAHLSGYFEMAILDSSGKPSKIETEPHVHWMIGSVLCTN